MLSMRFELPEKSGAGKGKEFLITGGEFDYYCIRFNNIEPAPVYEKTAKEIQKENEEFEKMKEAVEKSGEFRVACVDGKPDDSIAIRSFNKIIKDKGHKEFPIDWEPFHRDRSRAFERQSKDGCTGTWIKEPELEKEYQHPVGTALISFINFDIDMHLDGGCEVEWDFDNAGSFVKGWKKDLKLYPKEMEHEKQIIALELMRYHEEDGQEETTWNREKTGVPFYLKMYPHIMYDFEKWEYRQDGITYIKGLQERIKKAVEHTFVPADKDDKRSARKRYNDNGVAPLTPKMVREYAGIPWEKVNSLEMALSIEFYAMMYCNTQVIICDNCGLYSIPNKRGSRYCSRKYYTMVSSRCTGFDGEEARKYTSYVYTCREDGIFASQHNKESENIIAYTVSLDRERLRKFCFDDKCRDSAYQDVLSDTKNYDRLCRVFNTTVMNQEAGLMKSLAETTTLDDRIKLACGLTDDINNAINNEVKKIFMETKKKKIEEDIFLFDNKKRIQRYKKKFK